MAAVLQESRPDLQHRLGQDIAGFTAIEWHKIEHDIVVRANMAKFSSGYSGGSDGVVCYRFGPNPGKEKVSLKNLLLATGERKLAEVAKVNRDRSTDCDLGKGKRRVHDALSRFYTTDSRPGTGERRLRDPLGGNLVGKALMEVRGKLQKSVVDEQMRAGRSRLLNGPTV